MNHEYLKTSKIILLFLLLFICSANTQLVDKYKLDIDINLTDLADYGKEIPFVDFMKNCKTWIPYDSDDVNYVCRNLLNYPTRIPQTIPEDDLSQILATIWTKTDSWSVGEFTFLSKGNGEIAFNSDPGFEITSEINHQLTLNYTNLGGTFVGRRINNSDINNPIRNIRAFMPGTEFTHEEELFYVAWLEKQPFNYEIRNAFTQINQGGTGILFIKLT